MSRNPEIEAIHEARYDVQTCANRDKPAARKRLHYRLMVAAAKANPPVQPNDVLDALFDDYREFCRIKRKQEWPKLR
jgi:hypothetical protein